MSSAACLAGLLVGLALTFCLPAAEFPALAPLLRAHSHNDYEHEHPLADALAHGFWSVEADIWLRDGALLVAHDFSDLSTNRTLQKLYLDPLRVFLKTNPAAHAAH